MLWDHRAGKNRFAGIVLQEYSAKECRLIGSRQNIFTGTALGFTEAPHLYQRQGWYYLLTAEGGTGWNHAVTMARSRTIAGPYELHPDKHILSARHRPDAQLQRAGHADLVETPSGETYLAYLCGRPLPNRGRCTLGRETAIQKMVWGQDGWLRTLDGTGLPTLETPAPAWSSKPTDEADTTKEQPRPHVDAQGRHDFNDTTLPLEFQWLRTPWPEELFSLTARPGFLRLMGRETLGSWFRQSLVARRQQAHCFSVTTVVEFEPENFQQMAGLVCYYNSTKFHYLHLAYDEVIGKHLRVMSCLPDSTQADTFTPALAIPAQRPVHLRVEVDFERLRFAYRVEGVDQAWCWLPEQFDASILSDEATAPGLSSFTGAFVGMACQDLAGTLKPADFDFFEYRERDYCPDPTSIIPGLNRGAAL